MQVQMYKTRWYNWKSCSIGVKQQSLTLTVFLITRLPDTVKPVLRGQLLGQRKTGDLLRGSIHMKISDRTSKRWPFNTGAWLLYWGDHMGRFGCILFGQRN